ncbi:hypothetical protein ACCT02_38040, partial [Rhizobium ruizarguesonis]
QAYPILASFSETNGVNNQTVSSQMGNGGVKAFGYNQVMDAPSDAMRFGFGIDAQDNSLDSPAMPASYSPVVPTNFELQ